MGFHTDVDVRVEFVDPPSESVLEVRLAVEDGSQEGDACEQTLNVQLSGHCVSAFALSHW